MYSTCVDLTILRFFYLQFHIYKSLDRKIIILKTHSENGITTQYIHCREEGGIQSENKPRPLAVFNCYISSYISHLRNIYIYTKYVVLFTRYMRMFLWSIKAKRKNSLITTEYRWKSCLKSVSLGLEIFDWTTWESWSDSNSCLGVRKLQFMAHKKPALVLNWLTFSEQFFLHIFSFLIFYITIILFHFIYVFIWEEKTCMSP